MVSARIHKGDAHTVIIICLVVVLIDALGVVFYQNFIAKSPTKGAKVDTTSKDTAKKTGDTVGVKLVNGSIDPSFGTKLTFTYPETWKYNQVMDGTVGPESTWTQRITITSPSGKYTVQYYMGAGGGIGGMCLPEDTGTIAGTAYENIAGFSGVSYTELIYANMPASLAGTEAAAGVVELMDSATAAKLKAGDSVCDAYLHEVMKLSDTQFVQLLGATMKVNGATTAAQLKEALSGTEYEQGKAILLSTAH